MKIIYGPNAYALSDWITEHRNEAHQCFGKDPDFPFLARLLKSGHYDTSRLEVICAATLTQSSLLVNDPTTADQIEGNISNYITLVQTVLPYMIRAKYGRFVYLSSFRSVSPTKGAVLYGACKAFGEALFAGIGVEYESRNIRTASLRLGYLDGGLAGPRPDGAWVLLPEDVTVGINRALNDEYENGEVVDLGDHRG